MAITRAQQVRQMLRDGSMKPVEQAGVMNYMPSEMVTVPKIAKSSPDTPTAKLAYITPKEEDILVDLNLYGSLDGKPNRGPGGIPSLEGDFGPGGNNPGGFEGGGGSRSDRDVSGRTDTGTGDYRVTDKKAQEEYNKNRAIRDFNRRQVENIGKKKTNFLGNFLKARQKGLYNLLPNNPKRELEFLSSLRMTDPAKYNSLPQNLKDLLESTDQDFAPSFKDSPKLSFEDFDALTQFDDGAFAQYAKDRGSPGLSVSGDMSKVGVKSVRRNKITGEPIKDIFGNTLFDYGPPQDRGGGEQQVLPIIPKTISDMTSDASDADTEKEDMSKMFRLMADGGMTEDAPVGGIMDIESGRQMYFLGKLVKKATRAVKKIVKSPVGKAALFAGLGAYGLGAGPFSSGKFGAGFLKNPKFLDFMFKGGEPGLFNLTGKGAMAGIAALSAAPLLFGKQEEDDEEEQYRGERLDIANIRANPYGFMPRRFAAEGGSMKEPVAKKTMPLLDMDGKEKDYRETGGFVDMGRMERADDVPARLSKNEFVFTADAVRNAGDGSVDKGAEVMYNMMKNLESGGDVSEESQGLDGAREMFQTSKRLEEVL